MEPCHNSIVPSDNSLSLQLSLSQNASPVRIKFTCVALCGGFPWYLILSYTGASISHSGTDDFSQSVLCCPRKAGSFMVTVRPLTLLICVSLVFKKAPSGLSFLDSIKYYSQLWAPSFHRRAVRNCLELQGCSLTCWQPQPL